MKPTSGPSAYDYGYGNAPPPAYGSAPSAPLSHGAPQKYGASAIPAYNSGPVAGGMVNFTMTREKTRHNWGVDIVSEKSHAGRMVYYMNPPGKNSIAEYSGLGAIIPPNTCMVIWEMNGKDCGAWSYRECATYVRGQNEIQFGLLPCTLDVVQRVLNFSTTTDSNGNILPIYREAMAEINKT